MGPVDVVLTVRDTGEVQAASPEAPRDLDVKLSPPGTAGTGTNPEQLFAAGYGACFDSALRFVARSQKITVNESKIETTIKLFAKPEGGFQLGAHLQVSLPGLDHTVAQGLVDAAHRVCPYSNATRGNIEVQISLT